MKRYSRKDMGYAEDPFGFVCIYDDGMLVLNAIMWVGDR